MHAPKWVYVRHMCVGGSRGQKRPADPVELELQVVG